MNAPLSDWANFYMIVGSSGGALIGIQFVVITLVAERSKEATPESIGAFGTPTMVHFAGALIISAIMSVPWASLWPASAALALCGFSGLVYCVVNIHRAGRQTAYKPVWDDWLWYATFPCLIYALLTAGALFLRLETRRPMFVIGAAAISLLLIGIRNAWDSVTHIVVTTGTTHKQKGI